MARQNAALQVETERRPPSPLPPSREETVKLSLAPSLLNGANRADGPALTRGPLGDHSAPPSKIAGRRLGRYRLIERLGRGTQADVWKAVQIEPFVQEVALKVLPPLLAGESWRLDQFRHEAEVGASFANSSLLPTYEFGEINGITFIAMPFVDGGSLADVIAARRERRAGHSRLDVDPRVLLPAAEFDRSIARVFVKIARALHVAHLGRVIHRDIKPANILLDRKHDDRVFLCDFGLGFDLDRPQHGELREGVGSPLYMPPEKLIGLEGVDEIRCDLYALGVTLFEALTLALPLEIPVDLPRSQWAEYLVLTPPLRPREIEPDLPEPLEAIVLKATHRLAAERYATAAALADDLARFLREHRCERA
jgi:serine/threonine protein kinase